MPNIVCQVNNHGDKVELIWSRDGAFFKPYVLDGVLLDELRRGADRVKEDLAKSVTPSARVALDTLVTAKNSAGDGPVPWELEFRLAEAGNRLYNILLPNDRDHETAKEVRGWLESLRGEPELNGLELVVDERSKDADRFLSVPWNLVYDERPSKNKSLFEKGPNPERWRPFWAVRYNLTSTRRVTPLRRSPTWRDPRVIVVLDPAVYKGLKPEQRVRLDAFLGKRGLERVESWEGLESELEKGLPRLLYWLSHGSPDYLQLNGRKIVPGDLRNLLSSFSDRERPEGMLAFLNACRSAESGSTGSFLEVLDQFDFTGVIATERQTIDTFANGFGLDFLEGFLDEGKPLGTLLHEMRLKSAPLGLVYGAHCPPEIRVQLGDKVAPPELPSITDVGPISGIVMGESQARSRTKKRKRGRNRSTVVPRPASPLGLPDEPYPSLGYYDEADRALFTGRDADVVRFAATLDRPDTRILILHGESGTGKSSFLRAGVVPYLENDCVGYRFFRRDGKPIIVQAGKDLIGGLTQALLDVSAEPIEFHAPDDRGYTVDLRAILREVLGTPVDYVVLRGRLRADVGLFATLLAKLAEPLPHALIFVIDQGEEVFTLCTKEEEREDRDHALRMLQRVVDTQADVKLIVSLRTEYYGRLLDHLRAGRRDLTGVRDDLLRDFSRAALIDAITRPTSEEPIAPGLPSPREKYENFRYADDLLQADGTPYPDGIPGAIADGVLNQRTENQDSVLPLAQVVCTQLRQRMKARPDSDGAVTAVDFQAMDGVKGGLLAFANDALTRTMQLSPGDQEAFKSLFTQLFTQQQDGTLTTWMKRREDAEREWQGTEAFDSVLNKAIKARMLREDELRIQGAEPTRQIRLGHDALARVAATWKAEREAKARERRRVQRNVGVLVVAGIIAAASVIGGLWVYGQKEKLRVANEQIRKTNAGLEKATADAKSALVKAELAEQDAKSQQRLAQLRLQHVTFTQIDEIRTSNPEQGKEMLLDPAVFPSLEDRDFAWGLNYAACNWVRVIKGQQGSVHSVAFSPDGKTLATGGEDGTVRQWDASTGEPRGKPLTGHMGGVSSVAYSPDGKTLATGGDDGTVRLWDASKGEPRGKPLAGHEAGVYSVAYSPDGKTLATGGFDGKVRLWDASRGGPRGKPLAGHESAVQSVAYSPDGKTLATGGDDGTVRLWDASKGEPRGKPLAGHAGAVQSVSFSPDGKTLATGGDDCTVRLWDASTGELRGKPLKSPAGRVSSVAHSPDGKTLATGGFGGTVHLWDVTMGEPRGKPLAGHVGVSVLVAYSPDGRTLATGGDDGTVRLWDASTGEPRGKPLARHAGAVQSVSYSPDGKTLAMVGWIGPVRLWDAWTGEPRGKPLAEHVGAIDSVSYSPDGRTLATANLDETVRQWDAWTGEPRGKPLKGHAGRVVSVAYSPDGKTLATGGDDGTVRQFDAWTGEPRGNLLAGHAGAVISVAYSPDGKTLVTADLDDGTVRLWDASTGELRRKLLAGDAGWVSSVAYSPDGKTLATGGWDGTLRLWDALTGEPRGKPLAGHKDGVRSVAYSPDGKTLASAGGDGVRLWRAEFPADPPAQQPAAGTAK